MRRSLPVLLLLCLCAPMWGSAAAGARFPQLHAARHWIVMENASEAAGCTAYAIGPHALLTAEHCKVDDDGSPVLLFVDPPDRPEYVRARGPWRFIYAREFDGSDHMILLVSGPAFKDVMPYTVAAPRPGERVFTWGDPDGLQDQYREGYIMGVTPEAVPFRDKPQPCWLVDMPVAGGDSGSAVFDADTGDIVGLVTYGVNGGMFSGVFDLHFSPAQIALAQEFRG